MMPSIWKSVSLAMILGGLDLVSPHTYVHIYTDRYHQNISHIGFGNKFMANTYAVISVSSTNTQERILGEKEYDDNGAPIVSVAAGTQLGSNSWASTGSPTVTVEDGTRTVTFRRPYAFGQTYDFTMFMSGQTTSLDIISAIGMEDSRGTFGMHNTQNPDAPNEKDRDGSVIVTVCDYDDGSTPSPLDPSGPDSGGYMNGYGFGLIMAAIVGMFW